MPAAGRALVVLICCAMASHAPAQSATPFDGDWKVTLTCPPHSEDDEAKGYRHFFPAQVVDGQLRGVHGAEGEPGWHLLYGAIDAQGKSTLRLDGIVNNPRYAINKAERGKPYSYRVRASFTPTTGTGRRLTGRACEFDFAR